jgi:hypothetical protein
LLPSGKVLVVGGSSTNLVSAEIYDPETGSWTTTGSMNTPRYQFTAHLLPTGFVFVAGGANDATQGLSGTEIYDPNTGKWTPTGNLITGRRDHASALLADGRVLVTGGANSNSVYIASCELYDVGLGFSNSWRPQISAITSPLDLGNQLTITGTKLRGVSGGSNGSSQDSSTDYPLVQLLSVEGGQTAFLLTTNWSTNSFTSLPVWNFPPGWAIATLFVNGISSTGNIINISLPAPTPPNITGVKKLTNGVVQFSFTNKVGAIFGALASTNIALSVNNWSALGRVPEISPGQFQFSDPQATNYSTRFYRARAN